MQNTVFLSTNILYHGNLNFSKVVLNNFYEIPSEYLMQNVLDERIRKLHINNDAHSFKTADNIIKIQLSREKTGSTIFIKISVLPLSCQNRQINSWKSPSKIPIPAENKSNRIGEIILFLIFLYTTVTITRRVKIAIPMKSGVSVSVKG